MTADNEWVNEAAFTAKPHNACNIQMTPRKRLFAVITVFLSLVVAVVLAEIFLRLLDYRPSFFDKDMYVANADTLLPYKLRPGYEGIYAGGKVTVDESGYRLVRAAYRLPPHGVRNTATKTVLLLGDSGVFGQGLDDRQTFASQLQDSAFAARLAYRIDNVGVPGYTSWNELAALREYMARFRPDQVILVYVPNDPTFDNDALKIQNSSGETMLPADRPSLLGAWRSIVRYSYTAHLLGSQSVRLFSILSGNNQKASNYSGPDAERVSYSMAAVSEMLKLCKERDCEFSVGIYRDVEYYDRPTEYREYEKMIQTALEQRGISWFPITSHIDRLSKSTARVAWNDPHPSAEAAALITSEIFQQIKP
jgi:hypothetical protein